ncbi:beta-glucosidase [Gryllotalpicola protaetiae]|uniref:Family 3 glycosyl hydrolase n=1 Tax=Gryllotalpicola protaetiae TaxID=2419771 RepID=A0A387BIG1_9MICO|nr:glycoside hydrolase family 3 C-terminal domain-containing protein [Gryllotalpicola protaetiae]AYG03593.1 family 3 glycosyl hydrolase [Gryllotalpicola protaetiae]
MSESTPSPFEQAVAGVVAGADLAAETEALLGLLTPDEKLALLDGDQEFWAGMTEMRDVGYNTTPIVMGAIDRLGIPGLRFSDGPRGAVIGHSTAFPVSMARGATWNVELEERIGRAIGAEIRAQGANFFGGICINLPRHPAWGRIQETYGEDPVILGRLGAALLRGIQRHAMGVAKHYALNSMENARFSVDVTASDETLHEVYLPHFRRLVEEGVDALMTAYNSVNGEWAGQSAQLQQRILRDEWGFTGLTVSDFIWGLRDAALSLTNGLDVEEPFAQQRAARLRTALDSGHASWADVDRSARRILATQLAYHARPLDDEPSADVVFSAEHRALAREAAAEAMVLLKNDPVAGDADASADAAPLLPLPRDLASVAVIGRLADLGNTGDHGSSDVRSPSVVTPLAGLRAALPDAVITDVAFTDLDSAAQAAEDAEVAVVVVGYTAEDEGEYVGGESMNDPALFALYPPAGPEVDPALVANPSGLMGGEIGGDRSSLRLLGGDVELIRAVVAANPRTVVVLVAAGAVITEEWRHDVPAVVLAWYSGSEGGHALADVLLGAVDATGRLPYSVPTTEEHLPFFDKNATAITYDRWHGQRLLDRDGNAAAFPLGFGLSYTSFALSGVTVGAVADESFEASVTITNTGDRRGRHVVQLYGVTDAADFPHRVLLGFTPVWLEPGETATVTVQGSTRPLQRWTSGGWQPAADAALIEASAFSGDPAAVSAPLALT